MKKQTTIEERTNECPVYAVFSRNGSIECKSCNGYMNKEYFEECPIYRTKILDAWATLARNFFPDFKNRRKSR